MNSMASNILWQEDYWLLLMRLYMQKPTGLKPMYSRQMVDLCMELHLAPEYLYERMFELRNANTPYLKRLWKKYGDSPRRLKKDAETVKCMMGFFSGGSFYDGVEVNGTFEKDFCRISECGDVMPVMLILILDLYFRLTPVTMVETTPEVQELARLMKIKAERVVEVMEVFQLIDPYLNRNELKASPLLKPCRDVWQRYGNGNIEQLASFAAQLKEYFA